MDNENASGSGLDKYLDDANLDSLESGASEETPEPAMDSTEQPGEGEELSLDSFELETPEGGDQGLLDLVNQLGVLRNGLPVQFESEDQIREYLSKAHDYTQKTQELSDMRKQAEMELSQERDAFTKEREAFDNERNQFAENQLNFDAFVRMVQDIQRTDPTLYEELDAIYSRHQSDIFAMHENPALTKYEQRIKDLEDRLAKKGEEETASSDKKVAEEWENGLREFQTANAAKLRSLGIVVDYKKVQDKWLDSNSLSVKEAFNALYLDQVKKALEARNKADTTKKKTAPRHKAPVDQEVQTEKPDNSGTYMNYIKSLADKYAS